MNASGLAKPFVPDLRYGPALFGVLVLGLILLFFRDLTDPIRRYLVPSVTIYTIGAAFIGYVQVILGRRELFRCKAERRAFRGLEGWVIFPIIIAHGAWIVALIAYNVCRGVL